MSNTSFPKYIGSATAGGSGQTLISSQTANGVPTVAFNNLPNASKYLIYYYDVYSDTNNDNLRLRTSSDNGANYDAGANDYSYSANATSFPLIFSNNIRTQNPNDYILAGERLGNVDTHSATGFFIFFGPQSANSVNRVCWASFEGRREVGDDTHYHIDLSGSRISNSIVNAFEFSFVTGNIAGGHFRIYAL